jgi:hypothetical protein
MPEERPVHSHRNARSKIGYPFQRGLTSCFVWRSMEERKVARLYQSNDRSFHRGIQWEERSAILPENRLSILQWDVWKRLTINPLDGRSSKYSYALVRIASRWLWRNGSDRKEYNIGRRSWRRIPRNCWKTEKEIEAFLIFFSCKSHHKHCIKLKYYSFTEFEKELGSWIN